MGQFVLALLVLLTHIEKRIGRNKSVHGTNDIVKVVQGVEATLDQ